MLGADGARVGGRRGGSIVVGSRQTPQTRRHVVRQGERGDTFFIVMLGTALVLFSPGAGQADRVLARLGADGFFGELALLTDEPRSASIRADPAGGPLEVLKMSRADFQRLFAGSETLAQANSNLKERLAWEVLAGLPMFAGLDEEHLREVVENAKLVTSFSPRGHAPPTHRGDAAAGGPHWRRVAAIPPP